MYIIISLFILLVSFKLFRKVSGSLKPTQLNMISWVFYYNLILQSFIASILIINNIDDHYIINKIQNEEVRLYGWMAVQYTMIAMPLGMLITTKLISNKNSNHLFQLYIKSDIRPLLSHKDSYIRYPFYILCFISVLSVIYVMSVLKSIPLSGLFNGLDSETLSGLRVEVSREFPGNEYIKNIFAIGLTPILSYIAYSYYRLTKSKKDLFVFLTLFISSFFILTYNIAKGPFLEYLLGFVFLTVLINGYIKKKTLLIIFIACFIMIIGAYFLTSTIDNSNDLFLYNGGIIGRLILTQAAGTYISFDLFPKLHPFIGFSSVSEVINNFIGVQTTERFARLAMAYINPRGISVGTAGVDNTLFIGEAWANFGLIGVLISPIYVGIVIQTLFMFFLKMPKTPLLLGLFTYFSFKSSVTGGFNDYFYNAVYFSIAIMFIMIYFGGLILKK